MEPITTMPQSDQTIQPTPIPESEPISPKPMAPLAMRVITLIGLIYYIPLFVLQIFSAWVIILDASKIGVTISAWSTLLGLASTLLVIMTLFGLRWMKLWGLYLMTVPTSWSLFALSNDLHDTTRIITVITNLCLLLYALSLKKQMTQ